MLWIFYDGIKDIDWTQAEKQIGLFYQALHEAMVTG